jgi:hypothetical protein
MLELSDPRWGQLKHAYGCASDIPALLRKLNSYPASENYRDEPWYTLWSSLCHQGDIYPASFASVPHIISIAATNPTKASYNYFLLPASIEMARAKQSISVPSDLEVSYFKSLALLPSVVAGAAERDWDESLCISALAGIAAAKKYASIAEVIRELDHETVPTILSFLNGR